MLLKPLLSRGRLRLWVDDKALRAGEIWRDEIESAIAGSTAALLLVSADFLASDFIMKTELPAILRHGVRLLPVLVGACLWKEEPVLEPTVAARSRPRRTPRARCGQPEPA